MRFLKVEIAKLQESFALLVKIAEKWVPDELQSSRFVHGDPSGHLESIFEVQKFQNGRTYAKAGPRQFPKTRFKIQGVTYLEIWTF